MEITLILVLLCSYSCCVSQFSYTGNQLRTVTQVLQSQTLHSNFRSGTCLQSSTMCHSFSFSRSEEIKKFKYFTLVKFNETKSTPGGQTNPVNSTCQLISPLDSVSSCHTDLFRHHSHQSEQRPTVTSNDNLFIFLQLKPILNSSANHLQNTCNRIMMPSQKNKTKNKQKTNKKQEQQTANKR